MTDQENKYESVEFSLDLLTHAIGVVDRHRDTQERVLDNHLDSVRKYAAEVKDRLNAMDTDPESVSYEAGRREGFRQAVVASKHIIWQQALNQLVRDGSPPA